MPAALLSRRRRWLPYEHDRERRSELTSPPIDDIFDT